MYMHSVFDIDIVQVTNLCYTTTHHNSLSRRPPEPTAYAMAWGVPVIGDSNYNGVRVSVIQIVMVMVMVMVMVSVI